MVTLAVNPQIIIVQVHVGQTTGQLQLLGRRVTQTTAQFETDFIIGIARIKIPVIVKDVGSGHEVQTPLQGGMETGTGGKASAIHVAVRERATVIITVKETQATAQENMLIQSE